MSSTPTVKVTTIQERTQPIVDELKEANNLLREQLQQSESTNEAYLQRIDDLETQLHQLNDKDAIQTGQIKELRADLREESLKRELAETDIVNIGLHFFLKNVRPMLPPVTKHNTAVA